MCDAQGTAGESGSLQTVSVISTAPTTVRYWAGVRAAAGTQQEQVLASDVGAALDQVRARHDGRFAQVLAVCSLLVDGDPVGTRDPATVPLVGGELLDCLPPYAGG